MPKNIAIFASGAGSNAENILHYFRNNPDFNFPVIVSNNPDAYVHQRARKSGVVSVSFSKSEFLDGTLILKFLKERNIDGIVLAGFLLKIPETIIREYPSGIINIHPALLPKYGGKGMYGHRVHEAVALAHEPESGITIHYVNEKYDEGNIIFQAKCKLDVSDTPESIAEKVHQLEYLYFPKVIENLWKD